MEVSGQLDSPIALLRGKTPAPIDEEGFGEEKHLFFRIVQSVTDSLYRVPHPDSYMYIWDTLKVFTHRLA